MSIFIAGTEPMTEFPINPELTFPDAEANRVRECYSQADIILEYGSGGSTLLAASQPNKFIMSVESDPIWAINVQRAVDFGEHPSPAIVWHADIGPTGDWGRPINDDAWRNFHRYPRDIWKQPFFRHPDVVLIDGRFRVACFAMTFLRATKPVVVLFDDYIGRKPYHVVEQLAKPVALHGRLAEFHIEPGPRDIWMYDIFIDAISDVAYAMQNP